MRARNLPLLGILACGGAPSPSSLELRSALPGGGAIPPDYTCDGANRSIPWSWSDPPHGTHTFAIIVDDPDAPGTTWTHWAAWNIPGDIRSLSEGIPRDSSGMVQGRNDFGEVGWGGPCPPVSDGEHRYFARVYALDASLSLQTGASRGDLDAAMMGHVVGQGEWMARYRRAR